MRVFIFEFVSGGGWWKVDRLQRPAKSLLREGKTMLHALASDFAALPDCEVIFAQDRRVRHKVEVPGARQIVVSEPVQLLNAFKEASTKECFGVIIAPEFADHLHDWATKWTLLGGKLLGPTSEFIRVAGSKCLTAEYLSAAGVRVPHGIQLGWPEEIPKDFPLPALLKPDDGAGSQGITYIATAADGSIRKRMNTPEFRLEVVCPGMAVSVAILGGPRGPVALPACLQWLSGDRKYRYRGGMTPIAANLNARAQRLALAVAKAMPPVIGYFGVDMVLGERDDGRDDTVIEINPRLTTSYVGLRAISRTNLAGAMLDVALGRPCNLSFDDRRVQFTPDGEVVALS